MTRGGREQAPGATSGRHQRPSPPPEPRRGTLTDHSAHGAVWFTRYFCSASNIIQGTGFLAGAPLNSATYRAMQFVAPMWAWGLALVVVGLFIPFGRIQVPAFVGMLVWAFFLLFNSLSLFPDGAWALGLFLLPVGLHFGMFFYVTRGSLRLRRRSDRTGGGDGGAGGDESAAAG